MSKEVFIVDLATEEVISATVLEVKAEFDEAGVRKSGYFGAARVHEQEVKAIDYLLTYLRNQAHIQEKDFEKEIKPLKDKEKMYTEKMRSLINSETDSDGKEPKIY